MQINTIVHYKCGNPFNLTISCSKLDEIQNKFSQSLMISICSTANVWMVTNLLSNCLQRVLCDSSFLPSFIIAQSANEKNKG